MSSSITLEVYGKYMQGLTEYREGSNLILNDNFGILVQGRFGVMGQFFIQTRKR